MRSFVFHHVSSNFKHELNLLYANLKHPFSFSAFYNTTDVPFFQDLFSLDLLKLEWSYFEDAGARPAPTSFHNAVQFGQFMITYGGRFNDNSHSDQLNVLGLLFVFVFSLFCMLTVNSFTSHY